VNAGRLITLSSLIQPLLKALWAKATAAQSLFVSGQVWLVEAPTMQVIAHAAAAKSYVA
jgi:hypothetical protein